MLRPVIESDNGLYIYIYIYIIYIYIYIIYIYIYIYISENNFHSKNRYTAPVLFFVTSFIAYQFFKKTFLHKNLSFDVDQIVETIFEQSKNKLHEINIPVCSMTFVSLSVSLFNSISTFVGYLMPKPSLSKDSSATTWCIYGWQGSS